MIDKNFVKSKTLNFRFLQNCKKKIVLCNLYCNSPELQTSNNYIIVTPIDSCCTKYSNRNSCRKYEKYSICYPTYKVFKT